MVTVAGAAVIALTAAVAAFISARPGDVSSASLPGPPPSLNASADLSRAGGVYYYTIETLINYDYVPTGGIAGIRDQEHLFSERWVAIGVDGSAVQFRLVTRKADGTLWQEQVYDRGVMLVGSYDRPGDGATCSESGAYAPNRSTLPLVSDEQLRSAGFTKADGGAIPTAVEGRAAAYDGAVVYARPGRLGKDPRVIERTSFIVFDSIRGQSLGEWSYGTLDTGENVLIHATIVSPIERVADGALVLTMSPTPNCAATAAPPPS